MSSFAFDAPLTLDIGPSRILRGGLIALHALAGLGLVVVPTAWAVAGAVALVASLWTEWRRSGEALRLRWCVDGTWDEPGTERIGRTLDPSTFVSRWLVVLALDDGARVRRRAVLRDAVPVAQWRRLRARLRVAGAPPADRRRPGPG